MAVKKWHQYGGYEVLVSPPASPRVIIIFCPAVLSIYIYVSTGVKFEERRTQKIAAWPE